MPFDSISQGKRILTGWNDRFIVQAGILPRTFAPQCHQTVKRFVKPVGFRPMLAVSQSTTTKMLKMEHNEGRELVEYALIAVLVAVGVTLMLSGAGDQIANLWNGVASFVIR
jgi:Flp pilus assembly pilin Flp